jgi:hypothetical protein
MLPIIPPFQAVRFASPPRLAILWRLGSYRPRRLAAYALCKPRLVGKVARNFSASAVSESEFCGGGQIGVAVNRMESNFVLNPGHPEFVQIRHEGPAIFVFDARLFDATALS